MDYKKEEGFSSLDQLKIPKSIEKFIEEFPERYIEGDMSQEVEEQIERDWNTFQKDMKKQKQRKIGKRVLTTAVSLVAAFALFVGLGFVSPAVATVASKIPYLNKIYHLEPVNRVIWNKLEENGYAVIGVGGNASSIYITLEGTEQYIQDVRGEVKELAESVLESRGYNAYKIKITKEKQYEFPPETKREKAIDKAMTEVDAKLTELQFSVLSYGTTYPPSNSKEVVINIDVPNKEKRIEEIKNISNEIIQDNDIGSYSLKIDIVNMEQREKESRWGDVFPAIYEGLASKKEYKVTGFAYSFHPAPLQIIIKTSINSSDKDAAKRAIGLEKTIEEFLNSKEIANKIEGEEYKIIIRSKDKKQIN
ncbi:DUF4030 domain-containing protein [Peribacillus sp. NPDC097295]|uniref:DUF4030 domain-containing protein n=1 Tax=Peribacillus sp. NPDC097295 TaxID=3364402 RepID=UPI00380D1A1F